MEILADLLKFHIISMNKPIKISIFSIIFILLFNLSFSQNIFNYKKKIINLNFGCSFPLGQFKSDDSTGLFAKEGFDFDFNMIWLTKWYNLGIGFNIGYTNNVFSAEDFSYTFKTSNISKKSNYNFIKFGVDLYYPFTIISSESFSFNGFGKISIGAQYNIPPDFIIEYLPSQNIYTEIFYKPEMTISLHSEVSGGFILLFNKFIGINFAASYFVSPPHRLNYIITANTSYIDNEGAKEEKSKMVASTNHVGLKAGITIAF